VENQHKHRIGGVGVDVPRRGWRLVAGVVVMLLALVVVGRLQGGNLPEGDAAGSQPTTSTVLELTRFPGHPDSWRQGRPREVRDGTHLPSRVPP